MNPNDPIKSPSPSPTNAEKTPRAKLRSDQKLALKIKSGFRAGRAECAGTSCVEVSMAEGVVAVRDSKDPSGPFLVFDDGEWSAFVARVRNGEFDLPG